MNTRTPDLLSNTYSRYPAKMLIQIAKAYIYIRIEELSAAVARLESALGQAPAAGDVDRLVGDVADLRARVQERDVQVARLADLEREGLRDRVALIEGFLHAEMAKSEKILALMPAKKEGFFTRLFWKRD